MKEFLNGGVINNKVYFTSITPHYEEIKPKGLIKNIMKNVTKYVDTNIEKADLTRCKEIVEHFGDDHQTEMIIEECSELIHAIQKYKRSKTIENRMDLLCELADVAIMVEQASIMFDDGSLESKKMFKLRRTLKLIKDERNKK